MHHRAGDALELSISHQQISSTGLNVSCERVNSFKSRTKMNVASAGVSAAVTTNAVTQPATNMNSARSRERRSLTVPKKDLGMLMMISKLRFKLSCIYAIAGVSALVIQPFFWYTGLGMVIGIVNMVASLTSIEAVKVRSRKLIDLHAVLSSIAAFASWPIACSLHLVEVWCSIQKFHPCACASRQYGRWCFNDSSAVVVSCTCAISCSFLFILDLFSAIQTCSELTAMACDNNNAAPGANGQTGFTRGRLSRDRHMNQSRRSHNNRSPAPTGLPIQANQHSNVTQQDSEEIFV